MAGLAAAVDPSAVLAVDGVIDGCGCYCGKTVPSPCTEQDCIEACEGRGSGDLQPQDDQRLWEQRQDELIRQQRDLERQREAEARRRVADEKRRQEEFEDKKVESLQSLKGVSSAGGGGIKDITTQGGGNTPSFGLKGVDAKDAGLRSTAGPGRHSVEGAWRQLQCSEYIAQAGLAKARSLNTKGDLQEAQYLTSQALRALNGDALEVECGPAGGAPRIKATPPDFREHYRGMLQLVRTQTEILWRAKSRLKSARQSGNDAAAREAEAEVAHGQGILDNMREANALVVSDPAAADVLLLRILEKTNASKKDR